MRNLFVLLLLAMSTSIFAQTPPIEPGVSHELAKWRAARYSDVRYKLNLTLEKMSPVLKGTMEIRLRVGEKGSKSEPGAVATGFPAPIILDWRKIKGFEGSSTISNVFVNGGAKNPVAIAPGSDKTAALTYDESNEHLIFRDGVVLGENVIKLDFTSPILTSGSAITRYVDKEDGAEYVYSLFVPSDTSTAFPVFDQPDLKARFSISVVAPNDWKIVSNERVFHSNENVNFGPESVKRQIDRARKKYEADKAAGFPHPFEGIEHSELSQYIPPAGNVWTFFRETKPISTYVFAFAAGPWEKVADTGGDLSGSEGVPNVEPRSTQKDTLPTRSCFRLDAAEIGKENSRKYDR